VKIQIAYGGSCTGGKKADMDMYAAVLERALAQGRKVADGVQLYIQFGSQHIRQYAEQKGYLEIFQRVGASSSTRRAARASRPARASRSDPTRSRSAPSTVTSRGAAGPGQVYLASPWVVAASAIAGKIVAPEQI
jgi:3-isopropylmalate/(R)-2-methylmalate dehydratase large subunit